MNRAGVRWLSFTKPPLFQRTRLIGSGNPSFESYRTLHFVALSITAVKNIFSPNISFNLIYSATINQHISHISNPIIYNTAW